MRITGFFFLFGDPIADFVGWFYFSSSLVGFVSLVDELMLPVGEPVTIADSETVKGFLTCFYFPSDAYVFSSFPFTFPPQSPAFF
jgi:hypothetical protein